MFLKRERGGRNHILLASLIFVIAFMPMLGRGGMQTLLHALLMLVLLSGAVAAAHHHGRAKLVGVLASSLLFLAYFLAQRYSSAALPFVAGVEILFMLVVVLSLLGQVFSPGEITLDRIFGAISVYFLIALGWGLGYVLLENLSPGSFAGRLASEGNHTADLIYFSYITLTTLGYGDIVPATPVARSLSLLEASIGVLYMATLVARLVGLYRGSGESA